MYKIYKFKTLDFSILNFRFFRLKLWIFPF